MILANHRKHFLYDNSRSFFELLALSFANVVLLVPFIITSTFVAWLQLKKKLSSGQK